MNRLRLLLLLSFASCSLADAKRTDEITLLEMQQALVGKRLVDLTHAFAPGIPHWPGFPDEKRQMIYSFDKGRGTMGLVFLRRFFRMWASGGRMLIHLHILREGEGPSTKSRLRK